jgi:hypothetical protein
MSEPSEQPAIAESPISVILLAQALSTETADALQAWRHFLDALRRPYEILLIQEIRPEVERNALEADRIFPYERALGFRDALNEAIRSAQHPLLAFSTCDKQYQPSDLEPMFKVIDKVDMVVGYRAGGAVPFWRVLLDTIVWPFSTIVLGIPLEPRKSWLGRGGCGRRWIARWIFGIRVTDPECPFRLARRAMFARLPIQSSGPFVQIEVLAKANHLTCLLAEEPVTWLPPSQPLSDAIPFGADARLVFRAPDFGISPLSLVGEGPGVRG